MPTVPAPLQEAQTRVQVSPNARVSTQAPEGAFGSTEIAQRAISQVGNQMMQIAKEEKQKADDVATTEAYTKTIALRNRLMYDPKSGAMNRKGKDAFGVGEEYTQQFNEGADEIQASLTNEDQRQMYNKIKENELRDLDTNLTKHTFQQAQAYEQQTTEASVAATREDAVLNYQDPGKVQNSLAMQKSLIMAQAERSGVAPETAMMAVKSAESKTHEAVVNRMLANGQDLAASEYYKNIKGSMLADDTIQLEKALEEGSLRGTSQREAMAIAGKTGSLSQALAQVDKIQDPKIQDATRDRVKQRFQEREQAQNYAAEQAFRSSYQIVEKTRRKDDIPPNQWAAMSPAQKSSIDAYLSKDNIQTDWNDYYNLKTMAASSQLRDKFMKTDLLLYRAKLGDSEFKELVNAQTEARKGNTETLDGFQTDQQIVNGALAEAGIDPTPKHGSEDAKKVNMFRRRVDEEMRKQQQITGKKLSNQEIQSVADGLMVQGITEKGFFWDTKKRVFEIDPTTDKDFEFEAKSIPPVERQKIESALRSKGIKVNEDNVMKLYARKIAGQVVKRGN